MFHSKKTNEYLRFLPMRVLPVPGGPNNSKPLGGPLKPVNISLLVVK